MKLIFGKIATLAYLETKIQCMQWNLSDMNTLGNKAIVLSSEVSLFQGKNELWLSTSGLVAK